ncbi:MAG: putative C-S lyase [Chlorobi bacterium]|nr:putative C-S lyase [Chlorobiota bacterium]
MIIMKYDFDRIIDRSGTDAYKLELREKTFGKPDVIPLWVADMDFAAPPSVVNAIRERASHPVFGYTVRTERFNNAIINWLKNRHNWEVKSSWLEFSPGVVTGLALTVLAYTEPGDGVIIQPPVYPPFFSVVKDNSRQLAYNTLVNKGGKYEINFNELEELAANPKNKMLILSSPHNPVGRVWTKEELLKIADICLRNDLLIISDEIHSDLALYGNVHIPVASLSDDIAGRCVTFMAPSKTFNIAGFSTSYAVCSNRELMIKYKRALNRLHLYSGNLFGGVILESAYEGGAEWLDEMKVYLEKNIDLVYDFVKNRLPFINLIKPEATYLLWLDFRNSGMNQKELKSFLINDANVGLNDGLMFGEEGRGYMRMNIGSPKKIIQNALENIEDAAKRKGIV